MDVILLEKVHNLGGLGDRVRVRPGYGRNFLVPQGKAVAATKEAIAAFEERRAELEAAQAEVLARAEARAARLGELSLRVSRKAGAEGKLFGSVGTADIAEAAVAAGVELEKQEVLMPEGPLRHTGEFEVELNVDGEVRTRLRLEVVAEE